MTHETDLQSPHSPEAGSQLRRFIPVLLALVVLGVAVTVAYVSHAAPEWADPIQNGFTVAALGASLRPVRVVVVHAGPAGAGTD
ncbi:hypothetical protein [Streptomyces sp. NPDC058279]|uniref:hypothetical protein n=1 Tax=Streptomyces sp. NPDC058279 TaxID=3346418 RepID=UPI0036E9B4E9